MQISDLMGQYNKGAEAGAEKLTGTKGVENLVASLRSLTKGNIFEGTVSSMKNGRVILSLSGGQQIAARMEGKVPLKEGQSMFFQVRSNDGAQVTIRPFTLDGTGGNYTIMKALAAAALPSEANYLSMVNRMMEEQMPIDRSSLQQMARTVNLNSDIDVSTIVQMKKLGIPITPENASQFENYLDDRQAVTRELESFMDSLPKAMTGESMTGEQMSQLGKEVLAVVTEGLSDMPESAAEIEVPAAPEAPEAAELEAPDTPETETVIAEGGEEMQTTVEADTEITALPQAEYSFGENAAPHTLASVLTPEQHANLNQLLFGQADYTPDSSTVAVLKDLKDILTDMFPADREKLTKLFSSDEFKALIKDSLKQQWIIRPEELSDSDQINRLYEKLDDQISRLENAMKASGQNNAEFNRTAADIRGNIEFMNQINEVYTYVQIPLKMTGQNASGELYVYTNKKALAEGEEDLTAFLHLDLDHLGSTDVSVKMRGNDVNTNFYLDSDASFALVERNIPVLEERLQKKGYNCSISVINEDKHINFVEDFLKKDMPTAGQLHRYSFDMRA